MPNSGMNRAQSRDFFFRQRRALGKILMRENERRMKAKARAVRKAHKRLSAFV